MTKTFHCAFDHIFYVNLRNINDKHYYYLKLSLGLLGKGFLNNNYQ